MEEIKTQEQVDAEELSREEAALREWLNPDMVKLEGLDGPITRRLVLRDPVEDGYRWEYTE